MNSVDLIQLELAFDAFARGVLDVLLEKKFCDASRIADVLYAQAQQLDDHENFGAARKLEAIADFALRRADARRAIGDDLIEGDKTDS